MGSSINTVTIAKKSTGRCSSIPSSDTAFNDCNNRSKSHKEAIDEIRNLSGTRFDKLVVDAFIRVIQKADQQKTT